MIILRKGNGPCGGHPVWEATVHVRGAVDKPQEETSRQANARAVQLSALQMSTAGAVQGGEGHRTSVWIESQSAAQRYTMSS